MPFNVSNPVLYYNKKAFESGRASTRQAADDAGRGAGRAPEAQGHRGVRRRGFGLKTDPGYLEQWTAMAGKPFVNNGNGRKGRPPRPTFDNATGQEIFSWMTTW